MKVKRYHRTPVVSFFEMPEDQQAEHRDNYDDVTDSQFVESPDHPGEHLDISNFMRSEGRYHGMHGTSYFSAYGVILSSCGDIAIVASLIS